jgi:diguanylate cyclase (GGDEF)-like protein/PAS domain S-box-containing protein
MESFAFGAATPVGRKDRILVVDDEPQVLLALEEALSDSFDVSTTDDPARALRLLENEDEIAVVVSDQRMPTMNGDELFRRVRDRSKATRVLVTGYADLQAVVRAVNEGNIFAYITKPWDTPDLLSKLTQAAELFHSARELDAERRLLDELMTSAPDGIYFKDAEQRFRRANEGWVRLLGLSSQSELIGRRLSDLTHLSRERSLEIEVTEAQTLRDGEPRRDILCLQDATGADRWLSTSVAAVRSPQGEVSGLIGIAHDVTDGEHAEQRARLEFLTHYDELTGLPNRTLLTTKLEQRLAAAHEPGRGLSLVVIDAGRLRFVNESLGRKGVDELVQSIASRLGETLGASDLLARHDGTAFAMILDGIESKRDVERRLERAVTAALADTFAVADTEIKLSFKAGIALYPDDGASAETLIANAEAALNGAKQSPRAHVFYAPAMNDRVSERLALEKRLRRAVANEEFVLFYQPKVQLSSGHVFSLEALLRWRDPEVGLIPPDVFVPVLEDTEMILDVGRWVLEKAAQQFTDWMRAEGRAPRIAVNVSALQLARADFVDTVDAVLSAYPAAKNGLDLELTESLLMEDLPGNVAKLRAVRARGLGVAIDDFGTGYSSLGYLSRLPLDALKIDRSFIDRMPDDPQQMSIATTIISLARSLHLRVIAEGVETAMQAHLLRLLRCDEIQGYLVSQPVPAEEVVSLFLRPFVFPQAELGEAHGRSHGPRSLS